MKTRRFFLAAVLLLAPAIAGPTSIVTPPAVTAAPPCNSDQAAPTDGSVVVCFDISNRSFNSSTNEVTFTATANITGGHAPYTYEWTGGGNTASKTMTASCRRAATPFAIGDQLTVGTTTAPAFVAIAYPEIDCGAELGLDLTESPESPLAVGGTTTATITVSNGGVDAADAVSAAFFTLSQDSPLVARAWTALQSPAQTLVHLGASTAISAQFQLVR